MTNLYDITATKAFKKAYNDLINFEEKQFVKAFSDGSKKAWATYRANIRRAVTMINRTYGVFIDADALMNS